MDKEIKIMLSGGGSGGPVMPLLAVARELYSKDKNLNFIFIGTHFGPEQLLVVEASKVLPIKFIPILSGKFRRYFSWRNFTDFLNIGGAFFQSLSILHKEKPNLVMSAGAFVSVPLVFAARILAIPILIHQQDVRPGLANRLMAPFANKISVTFEESLKVYGAKALWTGNPYNISVLAKREDILVKYKLKNDRPLLLIFGGATGAKALNQVIVKNLAELLKLAQIIHLSGKGKAIKISQENYYTFEFLPYEELLALMSVADLVIARAGLSTITDLSVLHKAAVLVPMPNTHQEDNAQVCQDKQAAIFLNQGDLDQQLIPQLSELLTSPTKKQELSDNISQLIKKDAASNIANLVLSLVK